jgi:hypothetical protein
MKRDKVLEKQLEAFGGIEYTQVVDSIPESKPFNQTLNAVKNLMSTTEGRAWMFGKLELCGVNATPYVPGRPDDTAFNCGMQELGHQLQREIMQVAANEYPLMLQEAAARPIVTPSPTPQHQPS